MIVGYARVSTREQRLNGQLAELRAAGCAKVYLEKASGARGDRMELRKLVDRLRPATCSWSPAWTAWRAPTRDLLNVLDSVKQADAGFRSLKDTWADTTTPHGQLTLTILGGLAEFERKRTIAWLNRCRRLAKDWENLNRSALAFLKLDEGAIDASDSGRLSHQVIEVKVRREQPRQALASVEHPRLHSVLWQLDDLGDFLDGLLVIVDEVDHFTVLTGHLLDAAAQLRIAVGMKNRLLGSVRSVRDHFRRGLVKLALLAPAAGRERLEPRSRSLPSS
jgi:hypothetical protein